MSPFDMPEPGCAAVRELLDASLEAELPAAQAHALEAHLERCADCAAALERALEPPGALRALPALECPDWLVTAVLDHARADLRRARRTRLRDLLVLPLRRLLALATPAPAAAVLTLLTIFGSLLGLQRLEPPARYSARDVARAEREVRWALALIASINAEAGARVRDDVLEKHVLEPMLRTTGHAL